MQYPPMDVMERSESMQQRYLYMKPALQPSEAVLLPALSGRRRFEPLTVEPARPERDPFIPVSGDWNGQTTALSTQVRSVGSMAGRSVLRQVGIGASPYRTSAAAGTGCRRGRRRMDRR